MKMNQMVKRSLAVLLAVFMVVMAAACGNNDNNSGNNANSSGNSEAAGSEEKVSLNMWTWHPSPEVWEPILNKFYEKYPNIKVNVSVYPSLDYQQKVPIALTTGEDIDIVGVQATAFAAQIEPYLEPMDGLMKEYVGADWETKYDASSIEQARKITEEFVTAPVGSAGAMVIYYNMGILKELGLEAPQTYEDLKEIASVLKEKKPDVMPMAIGGKEGWTLDEVVLSLLGQQTDLYNDIRYNQASFNTPEYVQAIQDFKQMFEDGVMTEDVMDLDYSRSLEVFSNGQAAMFVQGTWESYLLSEPIRADKQIALEDVGLMAFPAVSGEGTPSIRSFIDIGLGVTQTSEHKKEAMDFIRFMTLEEGADMLGDQFIVVPSKVGYTPQAETLTSDEAKASYERMVELVQNPSADRNNLSSLSAIIGSELQRVILSGQDIETTVKNIQSEFETGKYN
ncbi:ABC transporter substrate-binding protein [Marinicrinis lubricantis]|uniref:ABC transporter substrate-binding protein n=1 Tax=Marinicrinis lubricantis TaxID=2086470 RepID=A0ABW1IPE8_9BACL